MSCFICEKHEKLSDFTGIEIANRGGMSLTHFPIVEGRAATQGHLILEPKRHITMLSEMSDEEAMSLGLLAAKAELVLKKQLNVEHVYFFRINDLVAHLHFHLVPRYPDTPKDQWGVNIMKASASPKIDLAEIQNLSLALQSHF